MSDYKLHCRDCYYFDQWIDDQFCECNKYPTLNIEESEDADTCRFYTYEGDEE